MSARITEEIALRIGLASRVLPEIDPRTLIDCLIGVVGEPLKPAKLARLRPARLRAALEEVNQGQEPISDQALSKALSYLKGRNIKIEEEPLPEVVDYQEGDMENSVRVACASNNGEIIDGHFGSCARFLIYQLSEEEMRVIDIRIPRDAEEDEDKNKIRAELIADCQVLYTSSIGGPAAAKVVRSGVHPIKVKRPETAPEVLGQLQSVLAGSPPPWLAKVMGLTPEERIRFNQESLS